MPNGRFYDNPLTDFTNYGVHRFPPDIMELLEKIHAIGQTSDRYPLGENWPYSPKEVEWEKGKNLDEAKRDLGFLLRMLEEGRGDEILLNPATGRPFKPPR